MARKCTRLQCRSRRSRACNNLCSNIFQGLTAGWIQINIVIIQIMIKNKLDHLIMGFIIMIGGLLIAFLAPRFLPELMKLPCFVVGTTIACLGCFQAVVAGCS